MTRYAGRRAPAAAGSLIARALIGAAAAGLLGGCGAEQSAGPVDDTGELLAVTPFTNAAAAALRNGYQIWNDRPGAVVFDYDRDGDLDLYLTAAAGHANWLYRNDGNAVFTDVAQQAGVALEQSHSTGAVACDLDNDGFQDLYVGAWGDPADGLGFRSPQTGHLDSLLRNRGDGSFEEITAGAFGGQVNARSAAGVACADVNGDGWLDLYVGNLLDEDFRYFEDLNQPGHYNLLFMNNGDLTFTEIAREAGVHGPQIEMRYPDDSPVLHTDPDTGAVYQGYDPQLTDELGNRVGEPTGQTHAVLFFDYDDDRDPDLWVANDGDRLHLYRNDSAGGSVAFTPVAREMGIDKVGAWMAFAVGDYDGDADLDLFAANVGFHSLLREPLAVPRATCDYFARFTSGTCSHFLLANVAPGRFSDVAAATHVAPSPLFPPLALEPSVIHPANQIPQGLAAYDFAFGATFFDYDNDGDQDLYWTGSTRGRGESPWGAIYPAAGRMLRGDGRGSFADVTVRARLLNIVGVDYAGLDAGASGPPNPTDLKLRRIDRMNHENGKGLAHGDLNGDGYVDLIATNSSGERYVGEPNAITGRRSTAPAPGPVFMWLNGGGSGNHWITLRLRGRMAIDGTGSNADAIGARVYLTTRGAPATVQVQEVRAGSSYLSMDSIDLEFGLGRAAQVETLEIRWPSGVTQTLRDLPADQILAVTEPES